MKAMLIRKDYGVAHSRSSDFAHDDAAYVCKPACITAIISVLSVECIYPITTC